MTFFVSIRRSRSQRIFRNFHSYFLRRVTFLYAAQILFVAKSVVYVAVILKPSLLISVTVAVSSFNSIAVIGSYAARHYEWSARTNTTKMHGILTVATEVVFSLL